MIQYGGIYVFSKKRNSPWFKEFETGFEDFFNHSLSNTHIRSLPVDVIEKEDTYLVEVDVPGFKKEDISLNFEDQVLSIEAKVALSKEDEQENYLKRERFQGTFKRQLRLGKDIDTESIKADLKDGILTVTLAKAAVAVKKPIEISVH